MPVEFFVKSGSITKRSVKTDYPQQIKISLDLFLLSSGDVSDYLINGNLNTSKLENDIFSGKVKINGLDLNKPDV